MPSGACWLCMEYCDTVMCVPTVLCLAVLTAGLSVSTVTLFICVQGVLYSKYYCKYCNPKVCDQGVIRDLGAASVG